MRSIDTPALDRDYYYWIVTFAADPASGVETADFCRTIAAQLREQVPEANIVAMDLYREVGAVDLQTDTAEVRQWSHCLIAELDSSASAAALTHDGASPLLRGEGWGPAECLTSEITVRKVDSGTAVPALAATSRAMPESFSTAIEYIAIPGAQLNHYAAFMRDVFGPVGRWLVTHGQSQRILITERLASLYHHPSMPFWNHIHILTGDFTDQERGFHYWTERAASVILGADHSVETAMAPIQSYRKKPKMSRNRLVASATFAPQEEPATA